jgi:hypothetical protein
MTISDILDRWTIALVKKHVGKLDMDAEIATYKKELMGPTLDCPKEIGDWFARLLIANARVWVFESEIRFAKEGDYNIAEIARRALMTRQTNGERCAVKQEIAIYFGEIKDVKTDTLAEPPKS